MLFYKTTLLSNKNKKQNKKLPHCNNFSITFNINIIMKEQSIKLVVPKRTFVHTSIHVTLCDLLSFLFPSLMY